MEKNDGSMKKKLKQKNDKIFPGIFKKITHIFTDVAQIYTPVLLLIVSDGKERWINLEEPQISNF